MTLVIARIHGDRVAVVSDTALTEHGTRLPFDKGTLKSWMFPGNICVSFCNSPELAERDFKSFLDLHTKDHFDPKAGFRCSFAETIDFFEQSSKNTGNDYIIAFDAPARLVKISDGKRIRTLAKTVWIGDKDGFDAFREYEADLRHKAERGRAISAVLFADEPKGSPASELYSVFRHVLADRNIPTVAGFGCVISNRGNGFRFSAYSDMLYDWPAEKPEDYKLSYNDRLDFSATGENAGYATAQIAPNYVGVNCIGFYFVKPKKLFIFYNAATGLANKCLVLSGVEGNDIQNVLNKVFGVDLGWLALVTSAPAGGIGTDSNAFRDIKKPGNAFQIFVNANTFPPNPNNT